MMQINNVLEAWFNKGFRGSKCKTLLKLASSRIKLLRNKRGIQLKQSRKELAQLLETGQEATARIRVEHIMREQNITDAYELLGHFCELLIVRMPIMELQRACPIDLKEAVASIIFAAPRASDLPELSEVKTLFSFKYGREFVSSATELWPDCGVNRMIIEKLSARAPTARAKLDVMLEIAEEFSIEWDPTDTEQELSKQTEDLLDGPNEFLGPIQMLPIPSREADSDSLKSNPSFPEKGKESVHSSSNADVKAVDSDEQPQFVPFVAPKSNTPVEPQPNRFYSPPRESSITQQSGLMEETLLEKSLSRAKSEGSMNLTDIIEAAEAAAENAEKAARAAREAAELCRSQIPVKSKSTLSETGIPQDSNPDVSSQTFSKGGLSVDDYDWNRLYDGKTQQENDAHQSGETADSPKTTYASHLSPDHYDWMVETHKKQPQEDFTFSSSGVTSEKGQPQEGFTFYSNKYASEKGQPNDDRFKLYGEMNDEAAFGERDLAKEEHGSFKSVPKEDHDNTSSFATPRFDGTMSQRFERQSSLEDDYYRYPNLFSKTSNG